MSPESRTVKVITVRTLARFQPKQQKLWSYVERGGKTRIGFGGARGGGKSHVAREILLLRRFTYPYTTALIFRRLYKDLLENHIIPFFDAHPELREFYNKSERILTFPPPFNSRIVFGYAEHEEDILNFHGKEYADIVVDEAQRCTEKMINKLTESNRCSTNMDITPRMILTFNPGDIGHSYLKRVFVTKEYQENEDPGAYVFIQAYGWDNVEWVRKALKKDKIRVTRFYEWTDEERFSYFITRSDYGRTLNQLPDSDRRAQLYGDWDVFEGQFFNSWRRDLHVIEPIAPSKRPRGVPIVGSIDYGQRSVLEVQYRDFEGNIVNFAECWTEKQAPSERFNHMADTLIEQKLYAIPIVCDTNMDIDLKYYYGFDKTPLQIAKEVFRERMGDRAPRLSTVTKRTSDERGYRVACNEAVKEFLSWERHPDDGRLLRRPRFYVTSNCRKLIETLPELVYDSGGDGLDFDPGIGIDDPYDAAKYALMALRQPKEKVVEEEPAIATINDLGALEYVEKKVFERIMSRLNKRSSDSL